MTLVTALDEMQKTEVCNGILLYYVAILQRSSYVIDSCFIDITYFVFSSKELLKLYLWFCCLLDDYM